MLTAGINIVCGVGLIVSGFILPEELGTIYTIIGIALALSGTLIACSKK